MFASNGRYDFQPQHRIAQEEDSFTRSDKVRVEGAIDGEASTQTTSWIRKNQKILKDVWKDTSTLCGRNILNIKFFSLNSIHGNCLQTKLHTKHECNYLTSKLKRSPWLLIVSCPLSFFVSDSQAVKVLHECSTIHAPDIQRNWPLLKPSLSVMSECMDSTANSRRLPGNLFKWITNIDKLPQFFGSKKTQEVSPRISMISWVKIPCGWKPRKLLSGRISSNAPRKAVAE